jgi:hypothetical protein
MKKIIILLIILLGIGIAYLVIEGANVQEIKTEINISAPPSKVWNIITDIDKWQEWSPIINASQGNSVVGSKLSITMMGKEDGKGGPKYNPEIIELKKQTYFHWRAHMISEFMFTNDKIFKLEETETGTHLIHIETFKGLMAPLMSGSVKKNVPAMLNSMNKALKELAEK